MTTRGCPSDCRQVIVDTSALVALLRGEDDAPRFARALAARGEPKRISAASFLETAIVIDGSRDPIASRRLDEVIAKSNLLIKPVSAEHAHIARAAYRDFGKGSGHRAGLNFGDCFAYALAKATGESLLFKARTSASPTSSHRPTALEGSLRRSGVTSDKRQSVS
jgi:ribonuclease VapC